MKRIRAKISPIATRSPGSCTARILLSITTLAFATAAPAQPPQLAPSSLASGQPQAISERYTLDSAIDTTGGPLAASSHYTLKPGYVGQLYDVATVQVAAQSDQVAELETNALQASATMDDGTFFAPDGTDVLWSVVSGPVSAILDTGVAQTSPVFADTPATVRGMYGTVPGETSFTILEAIPDNVGFVAGDGLDDVWQFLHFDRNADGLMDASEALDAAPQADPDGDARNNRFEILSGYDPTDPTSVFTFSISDVTGSSADLSLSKLIVGTRYRIQKSTSVADPGSFDTMETLIPASDQSEVSVSDASATDAEFFYRVLLDEAP